MRISDWSSDVCSSDLWGVDISILPLTKFWNGHSDLVMGAIVVRTQHWEPLWRYIQRTSPSVTSQDAYLVLRGVRTAAVRLKQHEATGMLLDRKSTRLNSSH